MKGFGKYKIVERALFSPFTGYEFEVWFEYIDRRPSRRPGIDRTIQTDKIYTTHIDFGLRILNAKSYDKIPHQVKFGCLEYFPSSYTIVFNKNVHHFSAVAKGIDGKTEILYTTPPLINSNVVFPGDIYVSTTLDVIVISKTSEYYFDGTCRSNDCKVGISVKKTLKDKLTFWRHVPELTRVNYADARGITVRQDDGKPSEIMSESEDIDEDLEKKLLAMLLQIK